MGLKGGANCADGDAEGVLNCEEGVLNCDEGVLNCEEGVLNCEEGEWNCAEAEPASGDLEATTGGPRGDAFVFPLAFGGGPTNIDRVPSTIRPPSGPWSCCCCANDIDELVVGGLDEDEGPAPGDCAAVCGFAWAYTCEGGETGVGCCGRAKEDAPNWDDDDGPRGRAKDWLADIGPVAAGEPRGPRANCAAPLLGGAADAERGAATREKSSRGGT